MSKHTPGPWRVTGLNVRAGDALVAIVRDHWANEKTPDREKETNARLIAAAPDLLEALQMMFASIHPYRDDGTPTIPDATVAKANAAIAKALGEN